MYVTMRDFTSRLYEHDGMITALVLKARAKFLVARIHLTLFG